MEERSDQGEKGDGLKEQFNAMSKGRNEQEKREVEETHSKLRVRGLG